MADINIRKEIKEELEQLSRKLGVKVLYAVESGSRAWGLASPDSDYDVRFIYVRKKADYLRLDAFKDVIEWRLDSVLDINGWDLKKALAQFHRSNSVLFEWSNSPIVYQTTDQWKKIYGAAKPCFSVKTAAYQYYGTANSTWKQYLQEDQVRYKKYFYALRPLLACRYVQEYRCPPPVAFCRLMEMEMPSGLREGIQFLLEKKQVMGEKETGSQILSVHTFIAEELARQREKIEGWKEEKNQGWDALNQVFLDTLESEEN